MFSKNNTRSSYSPKFDCFSMLPLKFHHLMHGHTGLVFFGYLCCDFLSTEREKRSIELLHDSCVSKLTKELHDWHNYTFKIGQPFAVWLILSKFFYRNKRKLFKANTLIVSLVWKSSVILFHCHLLGVILEMFSNLRHQNEVKEFSCQNDKSVLMSLRKSNNLADRNMNRLSGESSTAQLRKLRAGQWPLTARIIINPTCTI